MNENDLKQQDAVEIDLGRLVSAVIKQMWLIILSSVVGALIALLWTLFMVTPQYESSAMFYVNNNSLSLGDTSVSITSSDITASKSLVNTYIVILNTRETINDVIDYAGVNRSYGSVRGMLKAEQVNSTEVFRVVVTSPDPQEAEKIANAVAYILPKRISSIVEGSSAKVVESAVAASSHSSPSYTNNTVMGFLIGFVLSMGAVVLQTLFDITIHAEEDVEHVCKYPILAAVPDMAAVSKGGYEYSYGRKKTGGKEPPVSRGKQPVLIGNGMSFAASESYKLLRTKLQFSFVDGNTSHVIGVSSALSGEGKSLSAINLAYALSELGKRVVLVDCDMRRPTLAEKLKIQKQPGLSNLLVGQINLDRVVQYCGIAEDEKAFHVITAGPNPPNPMELLSSSRMRKVLDDLGGIYDYVILDLPPVGEVSDAMVIAKETDGILMVVRQSYCNRIVLSDAVRQFEFVGARILGVVYNFASEGNGKYGRKYYKKYYKRYYNSPAKGAAGGKK